MSEDVLEKTKSVDWSFPSSPNAVQFGYSKTGCYTLSICERINGTPTPPLAVAGFGILETALDAADKLKAPCDRLSLYRREGVDVIRFSV